MQATQIPLNLSLRDDSTFANFYSSNNTEVITHLKEFIRTNNEPYLYLWGAASSGRTHLLQACCHAKSAQRKTISYIALKKTGITPEFLLGMESYDLVCIDDVDSVLGNDLWEETLFYFYNKIREQNNQLIVTATTSTLQLKCHLKDLHSRLAWGPNYQLKSLNDEQILLALQLRANNRGLDLPRDVGLFLINRFPRNMSDLFAVLIQLDKASLIAKRRLTIPFVKEVLLTTHA